MTFQASNISLNYVNIQPTDQQSDKIIDKKNSSFFSLSTKTSKDSVDLKGSTNEGIMTEDCNIISIDSGCCLSITSTQSFPSFHSIELVDNLHKLNLENTESIESTKTPKISQTFGDNQAFNLSFYSSTNPQINHQDTNQEINHPSTNQQINHQETNLQMNINQQSTHQSFNLPQNSDGDTILHLAVIQNDFKQLATSLKLLQRHHLNHQNHTYLHTPLHLASALTFVKIARLLVLLGSSTCLQDRSGDTPLHIACKQGNLQLIKQLTLPPSHKELSFIIKHYPTFLSNPSTIEGTLTSLSTLDLSNYDGKPPLHLLYASGHPDRYAIIEYLVVKCAACVNVVEGKSGYSLLHEMVKVGDLVGVNALFNLTIPPPSPGLFTNHRCYGNMTALDMAVMLGRVEIEVFLRDKGGECSEYHSFKMDE